MTPEESTNASVPSVAGSGRARWSDLLDRLSERQMIVLVILFGLLLYLPFAGTYGLWDPWETHYGEVAHQMVTRGDFISLWWPGSPIDPDVFWSKPVLTFWLMSLSMAAFGLVHPSPGTFALSSRPEWALRLPFCLMSLLALVGVYMAVSRFVSRRAGLCRCWRWRLFPVQSGGQAGHDRHGLHRAHDHGPGPLCAGLVHDEDRELPRRRWRRFSWPHHATFYLTIGLLALTVLPQIVVDSIQLRPWNIWPQRNLPHPRRGGHAALRDRVCGLFVWYAPRPATRRPLPSPGGHLVRPGGPGQGPGRPRPAGDRVSGPTSSSPGTGGAWPARSFCPPSCSPLLACALVAVPWHHAMLIRHGFPFWNELYGDNHWRRLVLGRHGDRGSFEYFIRELGYGVFPWIALAPSALAWVVMRPFRRVQRERRPQ